MSWWAFVHGHLKMSPGSEREWRRMQADPREWKDWPEEMVFEGMKPAHVGATLDLLANLAKDAWLRLERRGQTIEVRGFLHEDAYRDFEIPIAASFRAASKLRAEGEIVLADTQMVDFAWLIRVGGARSTVRSIPHRKRMKLRPVIADSVTAAAGGRLD
jgi:hypothetical protein